MNQQRPQQQEQQDGPEDQLEHEEEQDGLGENQEQQEQEQPHQNLFLELTPQQQHAWFLGRFDWCFAVADHFEAMPYTTVEIAIRLLFDYMHSNHHNFNELPMDHVMRCSTAASLRMAMLMNGCNPIPMQELIRMGGNRFTQDEVFESEFHIHRNLGQGIVSPQTIESYAYNYVPFLYPDGDARIVGLSQPLQRSIRLATRDLLFLQYPAQLVGLAAVIFAVQIYRENEWEALTRTLYRALNIEEGSAAAITVTEIINRLSVLHAREDETGDQNSK
ncbi:MAG: hypothetical protein SGBAC_010869 [Bacillariaceae sp.]